MRNSKKNLAYIYYSTRREAASSKNMIRTSGSLGKISELTVFSSLKNIDQLTKFYGVNKSFNYQRAGYKIKDNLLLEAIDRLFFSIFTFYKIKFGDYEAIYTRDIFFLIFLRFPFLNLDLPIIYECHNPYTNNSKLPNFFGNLGLELPDKILCISEGVRDEIEAKGIPKNKLEIQRNCVDIDDYSVNRNEKIDNFIDINADKQIITYAGSFRDLKGVDILIEAFKILEQDRDILLILLGYNGDQKMMNLINETENVIFLGYLSHKKVSRVYAFSDILAVPSKNTPYQRKYTCPMKLIEYMASKTPIVASDLPTTRWVADNSVFYFSPDNPNSLADKINYVLDNPEVAKNKSQRAYRLLENKYTWDEKSKNILATIEEIDKE